MPRAFVLLAILAMAWPLAAQNKPLPPADAPGKMSLPDGFAATLFAGEPDVVQPIAFCFDDRGRLWVVECYSYPHWIRDGRPGRDRILIFEDRDGDGRFDERKVFHDHLANVSGIARGFGGVFLCATPNLLFLPDRDGDDVPDGPPEVLLDGWSLDAKHNVFSSLTWGPDGWLYGCNGILATSRVGKPGAAEKDRVPFNCGVWRYHPVRRTFEPFAWGTTNPWGLDFDDFGQAFITNCVIKHLWHVIPGAHFERMYGQDLNPHCYALMASCADHVHWGGGDWTTSRGGAGVHDAPGGGHAHSGAMVYLGDNWPERYRNGVFTCNIHGSRVNHDVLERHGSGYVARHARDFLRANDPWFRGIAIHNGPDGGVFVSDWTDTGECHNYDVADQSNGRVYKITHGRPIPFTGDLAKLNDGDLVRLQLHKNDWHVRHARRLLHERAVAGRLESGTHGALMEILRTHPDVTRQLRALWALSVTGGIEERQLRGLLANHEERLRGWAVRLLLDHGPPAAETLADLAAMAQRDPSPAVRLELASGLQRLAPAHRWAIAEGLVRHAEDAADSNLPLMIWYGVEPLPMVDPERSAGLLAASKLSIVRRFLARRLASRTGDEATDTQVLVRLLQESGDAGLHRDVLQGTYDALWGKREVRLPPAWRQVAERLAASPVAEVREQSLLLSVMTGDEAALLAARKLASDPAADTGLRHKAIEALVLKRLPNLAALLQGLVLDPAVRGAAIRGLAAFNDDRTPQVLLQHFSGFSYEEQNDVVQTLAARPAYALALLDAVGAQQVPRSSLSAFTVRQMQGLKDKRVNERLAKAWGTLRPAAETKVAAMKQFKEALKPEALAAADRSRGRQLYARTCASCHKLFGEGGDVGPEITGAQRTNLDYVLENLLDPSALVPSDYQVTILQTHDGRVVTGIVKAENERALTIQTLNEQVVVPRDDVANRARSPLSIMPEGLVADWKLEDVRDLIAYLMGPGQVPLPAGR